MKKGDFIKQHREQLNLGRDEFARKAGIKTNNLLLIEQNELDITLNEFHDIVTKTSIPLDNFWYYETAVDEKDGIKEMEHIKRLMRNFEYEEALAETIKLEKSKVEKTTELKQFIAEIKLTTNTTLTPEEALPKYEELFAMTVPDYDPTRPWTYHCTNNEMTIIGQIAMRKFEMGQHQNAISMLEGLLESRVMTGTSRQDRANIYPELLVTISSMYERAGNYIKATDRCYKGIETCKAYNNFRPLPFFLYNLACNYKYLKLEGVTIKELQARAEQAFFTAYSLGNYYIAKQIKKDAKKEFGIDLEIPKGWFGLEI